jgi:nitric oxide reductase subunit B
MKNLWLAFGIVVFASFSVLGWVGTRIYQEQPPIPELVVATDGQVVFPSGDIGKGQNVWQAMGGMEVGSIWGHGSYVAPDWTADWLHRECVFILNEWARTTYQKDYDQIEPEQQAQLQKRLERLMRTNAFDPATQMITLDPVRAMAFEANLRHYSDVFGNGNTNYAVADQCRKLP